MEDLANNILNIASEWDIDHSRELYRLENSLDARIDILANEVYNSNFKDNTNHV